MRDNINKQILEELRQAHQFNRKVHRFYSIFFVIIVIISVMLPLVFKRLDIPRSCSQTEEKQTWRQVENLFDQAEYTKALELVHSLMKKNPNYWYGYSYLGTIYHAMGDVAKAEENYAKAYTLFPNEDNEKTLKAIRKVIETKKHKANEGMNKLLPKAR